MSKKILNLDKVEASAKYFEYFGKVILEVRGRRQIGKTSYALEVAKILGENILYLNNNYSLQRDIQKTLSFSRRRIIGKGLRTNYDVVIIDNATYFNKIKELAMLKCCNDKELKIIIVW